MGYLFGVIGEDVEGHDAGGDGDGSLGQIRQPLLRHQPLPEGHVERARVAHECGRQQRIAH